MEISKTELSARISKITDLIKSPLSSFQTEGFSPGGWSVSEIENFTEQAASEVSAEYIADLTEQRINEDNGENWSDKEIAGGILSAKLSDILEKDSASGLGDFFSPSVTVL